MDVKIYSLNFCLPIIVCGLLDYMIKFSLYKDKMAIRKTNQRSLHKARYIQFKLIFYLGGIPYI